MTDPIKFTFAKPASVVTKKRPQEEEEKKDYVSGFSGDGGLISIEPQRKSGGPRVIPLAQQGHTKRTRAPSAADSAEATAPTDQKVQDRTKTLDELAVEQVINDAINADKPIEGEIRTVPLTVQNQVEGLEDITDEEERFKHDLASRPDEANEEAYEEMPIDEFGTAMLRGMGWTPGTAIGLSNKGLIEPIEFVKRPGYRLGLGAQPKDIPVKKKKYIKPGESREPPPVMVAPTGPDGKIRHVKGISEQLVPFKKGFRPNDLVGIVSGPHEGLYARVVSENDDDDIVVRLEASSEDVVVSKSDVSAIDLSKLAEGHPALKFMIKERKDRERDRDESDESEQKKEKRDKHEKSSKSSSKSHSSKDDSTTKTWLRPRIMVRVVSKSFQNGKYYNKKVRILDVVGRNECVIQLDNGSLVEGVKQRMLETVIPREKGAKVMVVEGENKGKLGTLLERRKGEDNEKAIIQLTNDLSINSYSLDDVAQYVGDYDEDSINVSGIHWET